ncbi:MAG: carboxypeptidase regulatory-like domain-containing protein, partial [Thermodesulfobacteriota bacterium]|nr:carboxypeptidase regulatory-like domain-containing protein [Thermodesulfobacteriota bacterium]
MGYKVAPAGDVNGDGFADIAVGGNDGAWTPTLSAYIIYGGSSPQLSSKISDSDNVLGLDFNGDGFSDLKAAGWLFLGGTTFPSGSLNIDQEYPLNLKNLGDLNNDSSEDLLTSQAIVFGIDGTYNTPFTITPSVSSINTGDWNVDGVPDLINYDSSTNDINIYSITQYLTIPQIQLVSPAQVSSTYLSTSTITGKVAGSISKLLIYGQDAQVLPDGSFSHDVSLAEGANQIEIIAVAANGTIAKQTLEIDQLIPPPLTLNILNPLGGSEKHHTPIDVSGTVSNANSTVTVNGIPATVISGSFHTSLDLVEGPNMLTVVADDEYGQTASQSITVNLVTNGPVKGVVTYAPTGQPVEGVSISVTDSFDTYTALTDDAGAYTVTGNVQGDFSITFTKTGYFTKTENSTVPAGGSVTVNTQLGYTMTISIMSPVEGARINATPVTVIVSSNNLSATATVNGVPAVVSGEQFIATIDLP